MTVASWTPVTTDNEPVHAHGGHIINIGGKHYFIGEDRRGESRVSIYENDTSPISLTGWKHIYTFKTDARTACLYPGRDLNLRGSNLERPKIIYNSRTGKFVMWMHYERKDDYRLARAAVAFADRIEGPYVYTGSFRPLGYMSRDMTLFKDEDGSAYLISASDDNATMNIYQLTDDYMDIRCLVTRLFVNQFREAPVLFHEAGLYYLLTSGCTGWNPNQGMYAVSRSIGNGWSQLRAFGDGTTYFSQSTDIIRHEGKILYLGDRWGGDGDAYFSSTYVLIPASVSDDSFSLDVGKQEL